MKKVLIIKLGALGDVLRTTPLLRRLTGEVTWVTGRSALPLLKGNARIARLRTPADGAALRREKFDWVINFDEDKKACALAAAIDAPQKTGALLRGGRPDYCRASAPWFDMSLISRLGRREADRRKYSDRKSTRTTCSKPAASISAARNTCLRRPPAPRGARWWRWNRAPGRGGR
jgi:heptosyltransferase-2